MKLRQLILLAASAYALYVLIGAGIKRGIRLDDAFEERWQDEYKYTYDKAGNVINSELIREGWKTRSKRFLSRFNPFKKREKKDKVETVEVTPAEPANKARKSAPVATPA